MKYMSNHPRICYNTSGMLELRHSLDIQIYAFLLRPQQHCIHRHKHNDEDKLRKLFDDYKVRKITKVKMAKELGISRPTLNRVLDRYGLKI